MEWCGAAEAAHFGVAPGEDHSTQSTHDGRTRAHGAGLLGDIQGAIVETPITDFLGSLGDGENFGVSSGVVSTFNFIVSGRDDFTASLDDRADGYFIDTPSVDGEVEGQGHEEGVVAYELRWAELLEGAGECWFG